MNRKFFIGVFFTAIILTLGCNIYFRKIEYEYAKTINKVDKKTEKIIKSKKEEDVITKEYLRAQVIDNKFTLDRAIELCKDKYGEEDDIIYVGNDKIEDFNGKRGYLIQIKSKELVRQGGNGVLFTVIVEQNGNITEVE